MTNHDHEVIINAGATMMPMIKQHNSGHNDHNDGNSYWDYDGDGRGSAVWLVIYLFVVMLGLIGLAIWLIAF